MKYNPSINIEYGIDQNFQYIVTPNAQAVTGELLSSFHSGIHSFSIIGTYGTGKSSYLMALERDLLNGTKCLIKNSKVFGDDIEGFECLNILGDYNSLSNLLADKLNCYRSDDTKNIFSELSSLYNKIKKSRKFLFIVVDEFGKILEHAAKNNPERELYFLQKLAEFVNVPSRNIILLTTLHQNFGAYAGKLSESQRNEWLKVKGRYKELVFSEPVEQLLYLASEQISSTKYKEDTSTLIELLALAKRTKFISPQLDGKSIKKLFPLDAFSAMCITKAIQRYGQNERTLFSFLMSKGNNSFSEFEPKENETFNLSYVYDYLVYNFFSVLSEANADSMNWTSMRVAIERVESGVIHPAYISDAIKLVKTIGLLTLFGSSATTIGPELLVFYAHNALGIKNAEKILEVLTSQKIIRYASYKSSYILFEGTDLNLEDELFKAANIVQKPTADISNLAPYLTQKAIAVSEEYYRNGTPRYFEYIAKNEAEVIQPQNDIDGYVELVFPLDERGLESAVEISKITTFANIFVVFTNVDKITSHLYEIAKLQYLIDNVILDDRVAKKEIENQIKFEKNKLNSVINDSIISNTGECVWIYDGKIQEINSFKGFNKLLSTVCKHVYSSTPILRNELFNKQKLSSAISLARVKLLDAMLENSDKEDFDFPATTCPPEKTIYYTLLKSTGIHRLSLDGNFILGEPQNDMIRDLWNTCDDFIKSTIDKPRKISDLIKNLKLQPFKLKQGVLDFWIPIFLFIKQQEFAIYNSNGAFVMNITKEFFELLQKRPGDFTIKAFNVNGIKVEFFKKYRQFLRKDDGTLLGASSFIETFKPFLQYYRSLNEYAKNTRKFENVSTSRFRDILASAKDPEKAFFEDMPEAFGYKGNQLTDNQEFIEQYLDRIHKSVRELNVCYDNLITRIENRVLDELSLSGTLEEYKAELENRYKVVKKHLLTTKCRTFLERVLAPANTSKEFYEKICNVVIDKQLVQLKDKEEELLLDNLIFLFHELDRHIAISSLTTGTDEVFNFEIASTTHSMAHSQTYRLPEKQIEQADKISTSIEKILSGDENLDVCVLLKMLNKKLAKRNG